MKPIKDFFQSFAYYVQETDDLNQRLLDAVKTGEEYKKEIDELTTEKDALTEQNLALEKKVSELTKKLNNINGKP